jgi:hypothetical protein
MSWFRNTKRSPYSTLRATGREIVSQWPLRTDARDDVQGPAVEPEGDAARPEGGRGRASATDRRWPGDFLFGR